MDNRLLELLSQFSRVLSDTIGIHFEEENLQDLEKKLSLVVPNLGYANLTDCITHLLKQPLNKHQISVLVEALTIGETYFFRDTDAFKVLEKIVLPELIERRKQGSKYLRIWCAACCTGEEPYSLAIILDKLLGNDTNWALTIIGTDVNVLFLKKAEKGEYKEWSFRRTSEQIKNQYFIKTDRDYLLIPKIKKQVRFQQLNLIEDTILSPLSGIDSMDLILCNNVLIYFSRKQIQNVLERLSKTLIEGGLLLVSPIEVPFVSELDLDLKPICYGTTTLFQKNSNKQHRILVKKPVKVIKPPVAIPSLSNAPQDTGKDLHDMFANGRYAEVISILEKKLPSAEQSSCLLESQIKESILLARSYASKKRLNQAREWCERILAVDRVNPQLYYLYANILQEQNMLDEALKALQKALFLDPNLVIANFAAGGVLMKQGNSKESQRHFRNALDLLKSYKPDDVLPGTENVTAKDLKSSIENIIGN